MQKHLLALAGGVAALALSSAAFADSQTIYLSQSGHDQQANITQTGNGNYVGRSGNEFVQNDGAGNGGNNLVVNQSGTSNLLGWNKQGYQSGTGNSADVTQSGSNGRVELQQLGTNNGVQSSFFTQQAVTLFPELSSIKNTINQNTTGTSFVDLSQNGSNNIFQITQAGINNGITVNQGQMGNAVQLQQAGDATNSYMTVSQTNVEDSANLVRLFQGNGNDNQASATQNGTKSVASVAQQNGSGNRFTSNQTSNSGAFGNVISGALTGTFDISYAQQQGSNNTANFTQNGDQNFTGFNQYGNSNIMMANQQGTGNELSMLQIGNSNQAYVTQTGTSGSSRNNATVDQQGNSHFANLTQNGSGNKATMTQR